MGQVSSSSSRVRSFADHQDNEIWAEVVQVSDQDVLVKDFGGKKRQKVKLNRGRARTKLSNLRLADKKYLDGTAKQQIKEQDRGKGSKKDLKDTTVKEECSIPNQCLLGEKKSKTDK